MRILVTGAPGWLGNRFLDILVNSIEGEGPINDWDIRCLIMEGADTSFLDMLSNIKKIEYVFGDVTKIDTLKNAVKDVDMVFHQAGIIHPKKIRELFEINTKGTENMLQVSTEADVKRFIYISSNSAGGTNKSRDILMDENMPHKPYMNYGLSKYKAECSVRDFQESGRIETVILRPCWFYGPYQSARQTTFFKMIKKGNPIIFGNGENLRSMSYLDNTCQGILLAAEKEQANGETYWIADARPYTCDEIYKTIAELLEVKDYKPRYLPNFSSEIFRLADSTLQKMGLYSKEVHVAGEMNKNIACSIEKAKKELGYDPKIELKEGMRRSIEWCRLNSFEI